MSKKVEILDRLPENFVVKKAIGPKKFKGIGNGGYFLLPSTLKGCNNLFVVDGDFIKKKDVDSFSSDEDCENCSSDNDVVDCPHFNASVCGSCCSKCPILLKCPIRNPNGSR